MRALIAYVVASTIAVILLAGGLVTANHRIAELERQLAAPAPAVASSSARLDATRTDIDRAEAGYQETKRFADDVVYSACRSQGGSRAACAKQYSK